MSAPNVGSIAKQPEQQIDIYDPPIEFREGGHDSMLVYAGWTDHETGEINPFASVVTEYDPSVLKPKQLRYLGAPIWTEPTTNVIAEIDGVRVRADYLLHGRYLFFNRAVVRAQKKAVKEILRHLQSSDNIAA